VALHHSQPSIVPRRAGGKLVSLLADICEDEIGDFLLWLVAIQLFDFAAAKAYVRGNFFGSDPPVERLLAVLDAQVDEGWKIPSPS
jgi:hypothetical protein